MLRTMSLAIVCLMFPGLLSGQENAQTDPRPRLIVLTDIGGDPDDTQSLVRLLVHADQFEIQGLIASASGTPNELKQAIVKPELIREAVRRYGEVYRHLTKHAESFPTRGQLMRVIKSGNPRRGLEYIGEGHDTEGSRWIVSVVDRPDQRPVNIAIWGGQTDLAQALWRVKNDRTEDEYQAFVNHIRIFDIADQDGIVSWIWDQFPELRYILSKSPRGRDKREATFRGMYLDGDMSLTSREWIDCHVRQEHGPLGAYYPPKTWTAPNPHGVLKEGDTPSWFFFLPNGLGDAEHPEWGGWGGRYEPTSNRIYRDAVDQMEGQAHARATVWRWRPAFQRQFQARMDWCVTDTFDKANHSPQAVCQGDTSMRILHRQVAVEKEYRIYADGSLDPDGDQLTYHWFVYPEAGTFRGDVNIEEARSQATAITLPAAARGETVHVILQIDDDGQPSLPAYRRLVLTGI